MLKELMLDNLGLSMQFSSLTRVQANFHLSIEFNL
jgi:hypothetical protein